jgi:hypothetical protein
MSDATAIETSHEPASTMEMTAVDESMVHFVSVEEEYERAALSKRVVALGVIVPVGEYVTVFVSGYLNVITCGARLIVNVPATTVTLS